MLSRTQPHSYDIQQMFTPKPGSKCICMGLHYIKFPTQNKTQCSGISFRKEVFTSLFNFPDTFWIVLLRYSSSKSCAIQRKRCWDLFQIRFAHGLVHTHTVHDIHTHSALPTLTPAHVLTSLSTSRSGPWNRWCFRKGFASESFFLHPTHTMFLFHPRSYLLPLILFPALPPPSPLLYHYTPLSLRSLIPFSFPNTHCTLASLPIWSSARLLLVRPGVVVGSPPSPSTPGQTFRSCIPCRNILEEDRKWCFSVTHPFFFVVVLAHFCIKIFAAVWWSKSWSFNLVAKYITSLTQPHIIVWR